MDKHRRFRLLPSFGISLVFWSALAVCFCSRCSRELPAEPLRISPSPIAERATPTPAPSLPPGFDVRGECSDGTLVPAMGVQAVCIEPATLLAFKCFSLGAPIACPWDPR